MIIARLLMTALLIAGLNCTALYADTAPFAKTQTEAEAVTPYEAIGLVVSSGNTLEVIAIPDLSDKPDDEAKTQFVIVSGIMAPVRGQPYAKEARMALKKLVFGKKIVITPVKKSRNGIQIVSIQVGGIDVGTRILTEGLAWVHKFSKDDAALTALETTAREKKIGLWQDQDPIAPWDFREQQRAARQQLK